MGQEGPRLTLYTVAMPVLFSQSSAFFFLSKGMKHDLSLAFQMQRHGGLTPIVRTTNVEAIDKGLYPSRTPSAMQVANV
jgi:hypothetical protein